MHSTRLKRNFNEFLATEPRLDGTSAKLYKARTVKKFKLSFSRKFPQGYKFSKDGKNTILHIFQQLGFNKAFEVLKECTIPSSAQSNMLERRSKSMRQKMPFIISK